MKDNNLLKIREMIDLAVKERTESLIKDFYQEVDNNTLISEMYGWRGILEMSIDRVKSKYLNQEESSKRG